MSNRIETILNDCLQEIEYDINKILIQTWVKFEIGQISEHILYYFATLPLIPQSEYMNAALEIKESVKSNLTPETQKFVDEVFKNIVFGTNFVPLFDARPERSNDLIETVNQIIRTKLLNSKCSGEFIENLDFLATYKWWDNKDIKLVSPIINKVITDDFLRLNKKSLTLKSAILSMEKQIRKYIYFPNKEVTKNPKTKSRDLINTSNNTGNTNSSEVEKFLSINLTLDETRDSEPQEEEESANISETYFNSNTQTVTENTDTQSFESDSQMNYIQGSDETYKNGQLEANDKIAELEHTNKDALENGVLKNLKSTETNTQNVIARNNSETDASFTLALDESPENDVPSTHFNNSPKTNPVTVIEKNGSVSQTDSSLQLTLDESLENDEPSTHFNNSPKTNPVNVIEKNGSVSQTDSSLQPTLDGDAEIPNPEQVDPLENGNDQFICCICRVTLPNHCFIPCGHLAACQECCAAYNALNIAEEDENNGRNNCPVCRREYQSTQIIIESLECCVCRQNPPTVCFVPCGHMALCNNCHLLEILNDNNNCLVCSESYNSLQKVFKI
ncbi:uncharacterized protein LOC122507236 [Leptopilina heterotoma]|uniref:uncharacterized protein LOC122507236 n=1 Tax=Leptopilina heterotoma TaxID=63436 RepID=UPI001CA98BC0|nr:uncharacterized protein LOC122507236 [Leptopilina heterotoma]